MTWFILLSLLIVGLLLVLTEILFVPGTTLVGLIGVFFTAGGIYYAFLKFDAQTAWIILLLAVVVNFSAIIYGFRSGVWSKFALKDTINSHAFDDRLQGLELGMEGTAISDIKPIGKAEIGDKIYEVKSDSGLIRAGTKIYIHKLENNKIIIKA
ncbi:NfeD family protein [Cecembia calidifontis]|uniref:NfeD-like partner-binding protein n=1 Tax=Cecembia calidifontis TaxID=1187080 RepID=A0A4Q7PES2_9BACT|nr:NfeD family protein [Cecembia calidifontis]RZS98298.1 NfeD-like partner-binding protein [Cecembia calidifontis]